MRTVDGELTEREIALYRAFLAGSRSERGAVLPSRSFADAAASLEASPEELDKDLARLLDVGLLRPASGANQHSEDYTAVSPLLAEATALGVAELELSARRAELEMRRNAIRQVLPEWAETLRQSPSPGLVDVVSEPVAVANVTMHYAERCQREVLSMAPGRGPGQAGKIDPRTRTANVFALNRGVRVRSIYQHVALHDRVTASYLRELVGLGAAVRIARSVPGRALLIDREVALLRLPSAEGEPSAMAVVQEPNIVSWVTATFEQLWADAVPLRDLEEAVGGDTVPEVELDQTRVAILRLMAEGEKDETISRRLAISVRTCRRHIADYMAAVGATSRFQAGVIAARAGHLTP